MVSGHVQCQNVLKYRSLVIGLGRLSTPGCLVYPGLCGRGDYSQQILDAARDDVVRYAKPSLEVAEQ